MSATVAAVIVPTAVTAPAATAAPAITAHDVASAPYGALFAMGAPVYERVKFIREPGAHSRTMIMHRLHGPADGKRGTARYVFLGDRLPESFLVSEDWSRNGTPQGLVVPMTRKSRGKPPTPKYQSITTLTGPVGEVRAVGWSHRYLG
ncbi:hypothetical protein [Gordonia neofelifaecis]|uniref:Uncharacterized protein n=1 Tax=Gordonia neofelifaecis NRRL B-59395 TaxID=644548 RepID=F1YNJ4_9ACTN|nr:hypothetical protein [Gordonia neofelifaecis]EGD53731.1 hypothetical protein SCNU_17380 [Gordonia neofelifaecis NRRL B-59395]